MSNDQEQGHPPAGSAGGESPTNNTNGDQKSGECQSCDESKKLIASANIIRHSSDGSSSNRSGSPSQTSDPGTGNKLENPMPTTSANNEKKATQSRSKGKLKDKSFFSKLNAFAQFCIVAGMLCIAGAIAFLPFLWFSDSNNPTWHWLVADNYLNTLISGLAEAMKQGITAQIAVAGAMLAALLLEGSLATLGEAADLSLARSGSEATKILELGWDKLRGRMKGFSFFSIWTFFIFLMSAILLFSQAVTIILLSDLGVRHIPGNEYTYRALIDFDQYNLSLEHKLTSATYPQLLNTGTTWTRRAPFYPTFAEYSEAPYTAPGVVDTGMTLRAFLPYSSEQTRQNIQAYTGPAMVVDTRVTCQIPRFISPRVAVPFDSNMNRNTIVLNGSIGASRMTPRLYDTTYELPPGVYGSTIPFSCMASIERLFNATVYFQNSFEYKYRSQQWMTALCQLVDVTSYTGGLIGEFYEYDAHQRLSKSHFDRIGKAYLVLNVTKGDAESWQGGLTTTAGQQGFLPEAYEERGEWYDLIYNGGNTVLSATLCYTSFATADIPIRMSSTNNRTEFTPVFNHSMYQYTYQGLRETFGQYPSHSHAARGILDLSHQGSWIANSSQLPVGEPFTRYFADMGYNYDPVLGRFSGNYSTSLFESDPLDLQAGDGTLVPDTALVWLFQEIVRSGGNIAFALQSILMVLTSMSYYEQMGQFDVSRSIARTDFLPVNVPVRMTGLVAVILVTILHVVVFLIILVLFMSRTKYVTVGETWQSIAQLVVPDTHEILSKASNHSDEHVEDHVLGPQRKNHRVKIGYVEDLDRVGLVEFPRSGGTQSSQGNGDA